MTSVKRTLPPPEQPALFPLACQEFRKPKTMSEPSGASLEGTPLRDRRDVFNGRLLEGLTLVGWHQIPKINSCAMVPDRLVALSEAFRMNEADPKAWVHSYEDDYRIERHWRYPEKLSRKLRGFAGVICPDHSTCRNLPRAHQIYNIYRNQLMGARLQADGINVIPNVRLNGRESVPYALAGIPFRSTLALGLHGCTKLRENRSHVIANIRMICDLCGPANLVVYGSAAYGVLDYPRELGIPVHVYAQDSFRRSAFRKAS